VFICTHQRGFRLDQKEQLKKLAQGYSDQGKTVIVAGDMNEDFDHRNEGRHVAVTRTVVAPDGSATGESNASDAIVEPFSDQEFTQNVGKEFGLGFTALRRSEHTKNVGALKSFSSTVLPEAQAKALFPQFNPSALNTSFNFAEMPALSTSLSAGSGAGNGILGTPAMTPMSTRTAGGGVPQTPKMIQLQGEVDELSKTIDAMTIANFDEKDREQLPDYTRQTHGKIDWVFVGRGRHSFNLMRDAKVEESVFRSYAHPRGSDHAMEAVTIEILA